MKNNGQIALDIGKRLIKLRKERNMNQHDFAIEFSLFIGRDSKLALSTISSWEVGAKKPSYEILIALASFYGVSVEYILGISSDKINDKKDVFDMEDFIIEINPNELPNYDGKPVFLVFVGNMKNRWGIYNHEKKGFCCRNEIILYNESIRLFAATPESLPAYRASSKKLDYNTFQKTERFWVEYKNNDISISQKYSGWYQHTPGHTDIINEEGNILPYAGFGVYYSVYNDKPW